MVVILLGSIVIIYMLLRRIRYKNEQLIELADVNQKQRILYRILNNMYAMEQSEIQMSNWLKEKGYKSVAIYGIHFIGQRLFDILNKEGIDVKYIIDKGDKKEYRGVRVYKPKDNLEYIDAVIITPVTYYKEIYKELREQIECPILTVEDLLEDVK